MSATNRLGGRVYGLLAGVAAVVSVVVAWVAASVTQVAVLESWKQVAGLFLAVVVVGAVGHYLADEGLVRLVLGGALKAVAVGALLGWLLALVSVPATTVLFVLAVVIAVQTLASLVHPGAGSGAVGWVVAALVTAFVGFNATVVAALVGVSVIGLSWVGGLVLAAVVVWTVRTRNAAAEPGWVEDAVRDGSLMLRL